MIAVTVPMKMRPKPAQAQRVLISGCWGDGSDGAARPHLTPEQATRGNRAIRQCPTWVMAHTRERKGGPLGLGILAAGTLSFSRWIRY